MIDRFKLHAKGGDSGSGCYSVRRSRCDRRGRPDGMHFSYFIIYRIILHLLRVDINL